MGEKDTGEIIWCVAETVFTLLSIWLQFGVNRKRGEVLCIIKSKTVKCLTSLAY